MSLKRQTVTESTTITKKVWVLIKEFIQVTIFDLILEDTLPKIWIFNFSKDSVFIQKNHLMLRFNLYDLFYFLPLLRFNSKSNEFNAAIAKFFKTYMQ